MLSALADLRLNDLVDIAIVAMLFWLTIAWFRNSRARMALLGLSALGVLFLVARGFDLRLTTSLLQGFFAIAALVLVVVFQDDLRRLFEGIAVWGLRRGAPHPPPDVERALVRVMFLLAEAKIGALIVFPGREPLDRHLEGGQYLDGRISEALLLSLFDPSSAGHDGAVIVQANKIARFGVHLPLSTDWDRLGEGGTRHAAALGLAERSDAYCLVVSEERGEVSIAHAGSLARVDTPEQLASELHSFIEGSTQQTTPGGVGALVSRVRARWREGLLALAVALGLWSVSIPGATIETASLRVPVVVQNIPDGFELVSIEPESAQVQFEGRRRDLYLAGSDDVSIEIDALLAQLGRRTFALSLDQVRSPDSIRPVEIAPAKVRLSFKKQ